MADVADQQIRALLDHANARLHAGDTGHGDEDVVVACERALRLHGPEDDEDRDEYEALYETSRARCVEIIAKRAKRPIWKFIRDRSGWIAVWRGEVLLGELNARGTKGRDFFWWFTALHGGAKEAAGTTLAKAKSWIKSTKRG